MKLNPTFGSLFDLAWNSINKKLPLVAGLTFVYFLGMFALSMIPFIGSILAGLLSPGYLICLLSLRENREFGFSEFFWGISDFQRVIQLSIMSFLKVIMIVAGFILLVIPGMYLALALSFAEISFVLKDQDGVYALKHSMKLAKGRWWYILGLVILICLTNLVGLLMLGIGILITAPLSLLVLVEFYKYLETESIESVPTQP